jgi:hypothetical protein
MGDPQERLLRQIFGESEDLHLLAPDNDRPRAPSGNPRVKFACGVEPEHGKPTLRGTFTLDNVTCEGCWDAVRTARKRS